MSSLNKLVHFSEVQVVGNFIDKIWQLYALSYPKCFFICSLFYKRKKCMFKLIGERKRKLMNKGERKKKSGIQKQQTNKSLLSLSYHRAFWLSAVQTQCCCRLGTVQHTQCSCDHLIVSCCCVNLVHRYS